MDPTYRRLIMQRRKKNNRKGFFPALLAGLAGASAISGIGKALMNRKSGIKSLSRRKKGIGLGQTITAAHKRRGLSLDMALRGIKPKRGLVGSYRRTGFDNRKGALAKKIIKMHVMGRSRKGRFNRRKGDLDSDFLSEFGGDVFNPPPTVSKSLSRRAYESLSGLFGSKEGRKIRDQLLKQGEKAVLDKINNLSNKTATNTAEKILSGKPIPKTIQKQLDPYANLYLAKFRG